MKQFYQEKNYMKHFHQIKQFHEIFSLIYPMKSTVCNGLYSKSGLQNKLPLLAICNSSFLLFFSIFVILQLYVSLQQRAKHDGGIICHF